MELAGEENTAECRAAFLFIPISVLRDQALQDVCT